MSARTLAVFRGHRRARTRNRHRFVACSNYTTIITMLRFCGQSISRAATCSSRSIWASRRRRLSWIPSTVALIPLEPDGQLTSIDLATLSAAPIPNLWGFRIAIDVARKRLYANQGEGIFMIDADPTSVTYLSLLQYVTDLSLQGGEGNSEALPDLAIDAKTGHVTLTRTQAYTAAIARWALRGDWRRRFQSGLSWLADRSRFFPTSITRVRQRKQRVTQS